MPNKTFLDFQQKTELASEDYIVGYKADGTAEFRAVLSDLARYMFDYMVPMYSLEASAASADEGTSATFTLNTSFVRNGTVIPYTITGINAEDLESGTLTGNFVVNNNTASEIVALSADLFTEGTETLILALNGITPTVSAALVINDTSTTPVYNLWIMDQYQIPALTANETDPIYGNDNYRLISLENVNVPDGTQIPYTITGISQEDINLPLTGNFTIYGAIAQKELYISEDFLTEGPETMVITLDGITPTVSAALVINDTSTTPVQTYNLYFTDGYNPTPTLTANETDYRVLYLETTNVPDGTQIPYTITGISQEDIDVPLTGNFTIYGTVGDLGLTISEDFLTEGPETIVITLDGITPTVSAALVINDTSTTPE